MKARELPGEGVDGAAAAETPTAGQLHGLVVYRVLRHGLVGVDRVGAEQLQRLAGGGDLTGFEHGPGLE